MFLTKGQRRMKIWAILKDALEQRAQYKDLRRFRLMGNITLFPRAQNHGIGIDKEGGVVQRGNGSDMEAHLPHQSNELQVRDSPFGPPDLGLDAQSLVEFHNEHSTAIMEGDRSFEHPEKAISSASLR
nr:hypothetical protein CFP56_67947 [Quercus suber]